MDLDETDVNLLNELSQNSRKSLRKIAKELGVSTVTVMNRLKKLEKEKFLLGFTTKIDPKKVGYGLTAIINLKIAKEKMIQIQEKLSKYPNICGIYDITGEYDSTVVARFKDIREMNKFIKTVFSVEGIVRTYTSVALNVIKEDFGVTL